MKATQQKRKGDKAREQKNPLGNNVVEIAKQEGRLLFDKVESELHRKKSPHTPFCTNSKFEPCDEEKWAASLGKLEELTSILRELSVDYYPPFEDVVPRQYEPEDTIKMFLKREEFRSGISLLISCCVNQAGLFGSLEQKGINAPLLFASKNIELQDSFHGPASLTKQNLLLTQYIAGKQ